MYIYTHTHIYIYICTLPKVILAMIIIPFCIAKRKTMARSKIENQLENISFPGE